MPRARRRPARTATLPPTTIRDPILRARDVRSALGGISYQTLWRLYTAGKFPKPIQLTGLAGGAVGWRQSDVERYIAKRHRAASQRRR